jgi:hypothetical protein
MDLTITINDINFGDEVHNQLAALIEEFRSKKYYAFYEKQTHESTADFGFYIKLDDFGSIATGLSSTFTSDVNEYLQKLKQFVLKHKDFVLRERQKYSFPSVGVLSERVSYVYSIRYSSNNEFEYVEG